MCKVLIIDDEKDVRDLLADVLLVNGIETEKAASGRDGLEKFDQNEYDIVITDLVMPGVNGNGVARHIRESNRPNTPIIGISGTTWLFDENQFDLVFGKPMSIRSIVGAVKELSSAKAS